ncbi:hypothetical protein SGFS_017520 [Streptomyces graminofaciens]|uniref:Uncharacterized protein n=1 Tax=Streptomyces graminofaciens TaxID=68212 RepID=A0ABM7F482_9ACTN|nr:hypothetical protein SGFS_017520 [Streptomyces graminofaciens]
MSAATAEGASGAADRAQTVATAAIIRMRACRDTRAELMVSPSPAARRRSTDCGPGADGPKSDIPAASTSTQPTGVSATTNVIDDSECPIMKGNPASTSTVRARLLRYGPAFGRASSVVAYCTKEFGHGGLGPETAQVRAATWVATGQASAASCETEIGRVNELFPGC